MLATLGDMVKFHRHRALIILLIAALVGVTGSFGIICLIALTGWAGSGVFWLFMYVVAGICVYWYLVVRMLDMPRILHIASFIAASILLLPFIPQISTLFVTLGIWFSAHYIGTLSAPILQRRFLQLKEANIAERLAEIRSEQEVYGYKQLQFVRRAAVSRVVVLLTVTLCITLIAVTMHGDAWFENVNTALSLAAGGLGLGLLIVAGITQFFTRYFMWQADDTIHCTSRVGQGWWVTLVVGSFILAGVIFMLPANISPLHNVNWDETMSRVVDAVFSRMTHPQGSSATDDLYRQPDPITGFSRVQRGGGGIGSALFPLAYTTVIVGLFSWVVWYVIRFLWHYEAVRSRGFFAHLVFVLTFPFRLIKQALLSIRNVWQGNKRKRQHKRMLQTMHRGAMAKYGREYAEVFAPEQRNVRQMFRSMLTKAEARGWARKTTQSAQEFSGQLSKYVPEAATEIQQLTMAYERARYANTSISSQRVRHLREIWRKIREALRYNGS